MARDIEDSGEIFEPKTVESAFRITCESTFAYLFAIDLGSREIIWLNTANAGEEHIAGCQSVAFLRRYFGITDTLSLGALFEMLASEAVATPQEADVILSDSITEVPEGAELIRSCDFERITSLLA